MNSGRNWDAYEHAANTPPPPKRRDPRNLAKYGRHVLDLLAATPKHSKKSGACRCLHCLADRYAARGFPSSTAGTPGGTNGSDTTPTEAAALTIPLYDDIDHDLAEALDDLRRNLKRVHDLHRKLTATTNRDPDSDKPGGLGWCDACGTFTNPKVDPDDRLRSGFCPRCHRAWLRWRTQGGTHSDFIHHRRRETAA